MKKRKNRDQEKEYSRHQFIAKLRRLADALESNSAFTIQAGNERMRLPSNAIVNIGKVEELEFQLKCERK